MRDCPGYTLVEKPEEYHPVKYEARPFWTYSLKYCNNPCWHIFGSMPCCRGLKIAKGGVDPRDFLSLPPQDDPLHPPLQPQFSPIF